MPMLARRPSATRSGIARPDLILSGFPFLLRAVIADARLIRPDELSRLLYFPI